MPSHYYQAFDSLNPLSLPVVMDLSDKPQTRVEQVVESYRQDLKAGSVRPLNEYVDSETAASTDLHRSALLSILALDMERELGAGSSKTLGDYCRLYPELGKVDDLPADLIREAYRLECKLGTPVDIETFSSRFTLRRDDVRRLLGGGGGTLSGTVIGQAAAVDGTLKPGTAPPPSTAAELPDDIEYLGDFKIHRVLGRGAYASVYLATQISLGRQVALKVSAAEGNEAQTMARLEHNNLVQVFSESTDPVTHLRLLCMQYVPGTTLEHIIDHIGAQPPYKPTGMAILEAIEQLSTDRGAFRPSALADRRILEDLDGVEAVCSFGARLADALAYAHESGVFHRDIKPANILVNEYGRPMLADFNVSADNSDREAENTIGGGTLAYMSPEHLGAFKIEADSIPVVDERSDIYSLGMVLIQLLTGRDPMGGMPSEVLGSERFQWLEENRRLGTDPFIQGTLCPDSNAIERVLRTSVAPDPQNRFQSADEMADSLESAQQQYRLRRDMPVARRLLRGVSKSPFLLLLCLIFLPHLLASVVNISYNGLNIVNGFTADQESVFVQLVLFYNLLVYPTCVILLFKLVAPVRSLWSRLEEDDLPSSSEMKYARERIVSYPLWVAILSCLGWLPGGLLFPLGLTIGAGDVSASVYGHFVVSFTVSGLIALTYSFFAAQWVALRIIYPRLWTDQAPTIRGREELQPVGQRLHFLQLFAGLIPLSAAIMILVGPEEFDRRFRLLSVGLISMGCAGFGLSVWITRHLEKLIKLFQERS